MAPPDVFAPARLGPVELRNRVIKAATFEGMTPRGLVTDELIGYHLRPARGGVGMTTVAYCAVSPEGRTDRHQIWMRPEAVPGLRRLTDAVHAEGAAVSAQLGHAGPVANAASNRLPALGPGRRPSPLGMRMIKAASAADLARIIGDHATAARTARDAGFDAVEIHLGHNYLVSSFLSPRLNRRADGFGGNLAGGRFLRTYPYQEAYLLDRARQFRAALTLPLILLGGITRKETMDTAMAEGFAFVALARALLREPDLIQRIQSDPGARSLCVHCNKCMPTIYSGTRCVLTSPGET
jgi:2,4-dienoyl-CoA reductase-like NADH-dependent reductase (Old Yellow Enzyme family)